MFKLLFAIFLLPLIFACNSREEKLSIGREINRDILVPVKVTLLDNLVDSLQPKTFVFDSVSSPFFQTI